MLGAVFEKTGGVETVENGFLIHRETLENGIRVVTVESFGAEDTEAVISLEVPKSSDSGQGAAFRQEVLAAGLQSGSSEELKSAVLLSANSMNAHVRGVCGTDMNPMELSGDGIVYVSNAALGSKDGPIVKKEIAMILEQLNRYAQEKL